MRKNVYNIVWADDEIDDILDDDTIKDLKSDGFEIIGRAHDGKELETCLKNLNKIDAVIVDANFNESDNEILSERDTSGLDYARSIYLHTLQKNIPFFLFTNRSEELLKDIYKHNPKFLEDFPRHKRWFKKNGDGEYKKMLDTIKKTVDEQNTPNFIIRNRYQHELYAAKFCGDTDEFTFNFLVNDFTNNLEDLVEPFVSVRRLIEKTFAICENRKLIPPISDNTNGTANYFVYSCYSLKNSSGSYDTLYKMQQGKELMPKTLACALSNIVVITQDASHSKDGLKYKVDEYYKETKDTLLLRSVVYILIDIMKWCAQTSIKYPDFEVNGVTLWEEVEK